MRIKELFLRRLPQTLIVSSFAGIVLSSCSGSSKISKDSLQLISTASQHRSQLALEGGQAVVNLPSESYDLDTVKYLRTDEGVVLDSSHKENCQIPLYAPNLDSKRITREAGVIRIDLSDLKDGCIFLSAKSKQGADASASIRLVSADGFIINRFLELQGEGSSKNDAEASLSIANSDLRSMNSKVAPYLIKKTPELGAGEIAITNADGHKVLGVSTKAPSKQSALISKMSSLFGKISSRQAVSPSDSQIQTFLDRHQPGRTLAELRDPPAEWSGPSNLAEGLSTTKILILGGRSPTEQNLMNQILWGASDSGSPLNFVEAELDRSKPLPIVEDPTSYIGLLISRLPVVQTDTHPAGRAMLLDLTDPLGSSRKGRTGSDFLNRMPGTLGDLSTILTNFERKGAEYGVGTSSLIVEGRAIQFTEPRVYTTSAQVPQEVEFDLGTKSGSTVSNISADYIYYPLITLPASEVATQYTNMLNFYKSVFGTISTDTEFETKMNQYLTKLGYADSGCNQGQFSTGDFREANSAISLGGQMKDYLYAQHALKCSGLAYPTKNKLSWIKPEQMLYVKGNPEDGSATLYTLVSYELNWTHEYDEFNSNCNQNVHTVDHASLSSSPHSWLTVLYLTLQSSPALFDPKSTNSGLSETLVDNQWDLLLAPLVVSSDPLNSTDEFPGWFAATKKVAAMVAEHIAGTATVIHRPSEGLSVENLNSVFPEDTSATTLGGLEILKVSSSDRSQFAVSSGSGQQTIYNAGTHEIDVYDRGVNTYAWSDLNQVIKTASNLSVSYMTDQSCGDAYSIPLGSLSILPHLYKGMDFETAYGRPGVKCESNGGGNQCNGTGSTTCSTLHITCTSVSASAATEASGNGTRIDKPVAEDNCTPQDSTDHIFIPKVTLSWTCECTYNDNGTNKTDCSGTTQLDPYLLADQSDCSRLVPEVKAYCISCPVQGDSEHTYAKGGYYRTGNYKARYNDISSHRTASNFWKLYLEGSTGNELKFYSPQSVWAFRKTTLNNMIADTNLSLAERTAAKQIRDYLENMTRYISQELQEADSAPLLVSSFAEPVSTIPIGKRLNLYNSNLYVSDAEPYVPIAQASKTNPAIGECGPASLDKAEGPSPLSGQSTSSKSKLYGIRNGGGCFGTDVLESENYTASFSFNYGVPIRFVRVADGRPRVQTSSVHPALQIAQSAYGSPFVYSQISNTLKNPEWGSANNKLLRSVVSITIDGQTGSPTYGSNVSLTNLTYASLDAGQTAYTDFRYANEDAVITLPAPSVGSLTSDRAHFLGASWGLDPVFDPDPSVPFLRGEFCPDSGGGSNSDYSVALNTPKNGATIYSVSTFQGKVSKGGSKTDPDLTGHVSFSGDASGTMTSTTAAGNFSKAVVMSASPGAVTVELDYVPNADTSVDVIYNWMGFYDASCRSAADCAPPKACVDGETGRGRCSNQCELNQECRAGEVCKAGTCENPSQSGGSQGCQSNGDCAFNYHCAEDNTCVPNLDTCESNFDCDLHEACIGNICMPLGCANDSDCGAGQTCIDAPNGYCKSLPWCIPTTSCATCDAYGSPWKCQSSGTGGHQSLLCCTGDLPPGGKNLACNPPSTERCDQFHSCSLPSEVCAAGHCYTPCTEAACGNSAKCEPIKNDQGNSVEICCQTVTPLPGVIYNDCDTNVNACFNVQNCGQCASPLTCLPNNGHPICCSNTVPPPGSVQNNCGANP